MLVVFDGPDGSGKSTLMKAVQKQLEESVGQEGVVSTREPGGTTLGNSLRDLILKSDYEVDQAARLFMYMSDRAQNYKEILKPNLDKNKIVISDRFWESTIVYQCMEFGYSLEKINDLHNIATNGLKPDLLVVINSDKAHGFQDEDYFDKKGDNFRKRISKHYEDLFYSHSLEESAEGKQLSKMIDYPILYIDTTEIKLKEYPNVAQKIINNIFNKKS